MPVTIFFYQQGSKWHLRFYKYTSKNPMHWVYEVVSSAPMSWNLGSNLRVKTKKILIIHKFGENYWIPP